MKFERDEILGIFVSIVIVVAFFAAMRFDAFSTLFASIKGKGLEPSREVVTLPQDGEGGSLTQALAGAMTSTGRIEKLIVQDSEVGQGEELTAGKSATVHYVGLLQNGTEFDNSYTKGEPYTFVMGSGMVIEGWDLGLIGMREGGERVLVVPAHLAYGTEGSGKVPGNSTLLFSVELISVD